MKMVLFINFFWLFLESWMHEVLSYELLSLKIKEILDDIFNKIRKTSHL